jgi:hypothetical protein
MYDLAPAAEYARTEDEMNRPFALLGILAAAALSCSTPLATVPADRGTYHDAAGFSIQYPATWQRLDTGEHPIVWATEVPPGTNLLEKRMEIDVRRHEGECRQATYGTGGNHPAPAQVTVNGVDLLKEFGGGIAAGNFYETTSYSTVRGESCIAVTFVLHSSSSGVYATEPPPFDEAAESALFDELISTFRFEN